MAKTAGGFKRINVLVITQQFLKGNKALFESIGKTPAATVEFKGFQDYAGDLFNVAKALIKQEPPWHCKWYKYVC
jgi:hypothetical protein